MRDAIADLELVAEDWSPQQALSWAFETFGDQVAIASAFGAEGMVLIDIASGLRKDFRVFTIDTEFLFPETHVLIDRIEQRYGVKVEKVFSHLSPEMQERSYGDALWASNPDQCCNLRKVEPLRRKLKGLKAWVTSIRRDQTSFRGEARKIQWDERFGLVKVNPVANWTSSQIWSYLREHDVPYNSLHDRNYPSIGCTHCTRAVLPGEDPRAGRWAGSNKTECGLHEIRPIQPLPEAGA